jgi:hypothetical protein
LTRESIFSQIFDPYNAVSTNNNLNQYVLGIRKQIIYLGLEDEIIKTVPRVGFTIPSYIRIEKQIGSEIIAGSANNASSRSYQKSTWHWFMMCWLGLLFLLLTLSSLYYFVDVQNVLSMERTPLTKLEKISSQQGCDIFILPGSLRINESDEFRAIEKNAELPCRPTVGSRFYYSIQQTPYNKTRQFVMRCEGPSNNPACYSVYRSNEGDK